MNQTEQPIKSPEQLASELAPNAAIMENIDRNRAELRHIFDKTDKRLVVITGPCSIHSIPAATNIATAEALIHSLGRGDLDWRELVHTKK